MHILGCMMVLGAAWKVEDNFVELVLFSHLYMGSGGRTQLIRLVWKVHLPMEPSYQLLIVD